MNRREKDALDRHITGNYGEDSLPNESVESHITVREVGNVWWVMHVIVLEGFDSYRDALSMATRRAHNNDLPLVVDNIEV